MTWTKEEDAAVRAANSTAEAMQIALDGRTPNAIAQRWYKLRRESAVVAADPPAAPEILESPVIDVTFAATRPEDMAQAQRAMCEWAARKLDAVKAELADAGEALAEAAEAGWRTERFERAANKIGQRVTFYEKIKAALDAGYYIVPPFPIDIFTIRTDRRKPNARRTTNSWSRHAQQPRLLPVGAGRYVSDTPTIYQQTIPTAETGKDKDVTEYFAEAFRDVDFPFALARSEVMRATAAAMALKVFDQLGVLPARRATADPIVCGQILKPDYWRTPVTFFVAWWLDTRTL